MQFNRLALFAAVLTFAACGGSADSAPAADATPAPAAEAAAVIVLFRVVTLWFGAGLAATLGARRPDLDAEA